MSLRPLRLCARLLCIFLIWKSVAAAEPAWHTGPKFRAAIDAPFAAAWKNVELQDVLNQIQQQTRVAILLDRRIDPNQSLEVNFTGKPLKVGLADLAEQIGQAISTPENVVYIGPPDSCRKLRTLISLRQQEWRRLEADRKQPRTAVRWQDLDAPAEILKSMGDRHRADFSNLDVIEHDLWAAGVLPSVTQIEALSLILIQFDLTFRAQSAGPRAMIELIPVPDDVSMEEEHSLPAKMPDQRLAEWQSRFPGLRFDRSGLKVNVSATIEEHEALRAPPAKNSPKPARTLAKEVFSLKIKDVSVRDLMTELKKSGVKFDYDEEEFKKAGVDLDQFIELDVEMLRAEKFFETIFGPLQVRAEIEGMSVKLSPKR